MQPSPIVCADDTDALSFPWGAIKWLMNQETDADARQTFGIAYINPDEQNPPHYHPNCEELLYVLSGACEHTLGDQSYRMDPGDLIRVPAVHQAVNTGREPLCAVISFSSADRQTVFIDAEKA